MSKKDTAEEKLRSIRHGQTASLSDIIKVAKIYGVDIASPKRGSHYLVKDKLLKDFEKERGKNEIVDNTICLPVKNRKVKGVYVKRFIEFIDYKIKIINRNSERND